MSVEQNGNSPLWTPDNQSHQLEGTVYAWGKLARLRIEPALLEVMSATDRDLVVVDLCSSYPYLRQIMAGRHKERMELKTQKVTGEFINDFNAPIQKNRFPFAAQLDKDTLVKLRDELPQRHGVGRKLLNAAVYDLLLNPPPADDRTLRSFRNNLFRKFMRSQTITKHVIEPEGKQGAKGTWVFIASEDAGVSLSDVLEPILGDRTPRFLWEVALYFGTKLRAAHQVRRVKFVSLDNAPFPQLVAQAKGGFPERIHNTLFFQSAQQSGVHNVEHVQGDLLELPFGKGEVDFFSSIEGWPYYGNPLRFEGNMVVAKKIAEQLAKGGKGVFFPWKMEMDTVASHEWLSSIVAYWGKLGLVVEPESVTKDQLEEKMTQREWELSKYSPLFRETGIFTSLTVSRAA